MVDAEISVCQNRPDSNVKVKHRDCDHHQQESAQWHKDEQSIIIIK